MLFVGVDWCRKRWESLRAQHRKVIRARITATDDQDIIQRKWKYEDEMAFLITHMARRAKTRLPEASGREFESGDDRSSCEDFEVKRPVSTLVKTEPNTEDPLGGDAATSAFGRITPDEQEQNDIDLPSPTDALDYFFAWVKGTMRKFTPQDVVEVRTKIFNIVSEAETKYL